jgi:hypothetical protein
MARTKPGTWTWLLRRWKDSWCPARRQTGSWNWKRKLARPTGGLETERLWRSWNRREDSSYSPSPAAMEKTTTAAAPPFQGSLLTPWAAEMAYTWGSPRWPKISLRLFCGVAREENAEAPGGFISGRGRGGKMRCSQIRPWRKDNPKWN